ncbi:hypothetical protein EK21DRAFT_70964 [Setomelanomma holmii]|uniref:Uncharacterized protein n=1 Tax=Setomelanomma holmii TaxID=210430 RepID=A0A9P4H6A5_9PLEO|nr:hypothetical protein EK21DRAFT_70964 [Setomelanomma holmii]
MDTTQTQSAGRHPSSTLSPLKQHPISPGLPASSSIVTQTILLDNPSAKLSCSPASSPRTVDPSLMRRGSVYPALSNTMEEGITPGADFFDDDSSESEWEDSEGDVTQTFSEADEKGLRSLVHGITDDIDGTSRGRSREWYSVTALQTFRQPPADFGLGIQSDGKPLTSPVEADDTKRARQMSLKRLNKANVRIVHNRSNAGTPRGSIRSSMSLSESGAPFPELSDVFTDKIASPSELPHSSSFQGRHRRNTSESIIEGSIIDAHVMTMRALESLDQSPSGILNDPDSQIFPKLSSFTNNRHIKLSPLKTRSTERDTERPAHLPDHFIKTPYPFTAKKEFPKPISRPRQHSGVDRPYSGGTDGFTRLDSGYGDGEDLEKKEYDDKKGKHVLGLMASGGEYDLRSRLERKEDAQGVIRSRAGSGREGGESTVWLSLERQSWRKSPWSEQAKKLVKVTVPTNLTMSSPDRELKSNSGPATIDFDDKFFAERIRAGYRTLSGSWFRRTFSARILQAIRLGQVNTWSGAPVHASLPRSSGLLAAGAGIDVDDDSRSPFTEESLMKLYRKPAVGKARYTWVHWARRVAASNVARPKKRTSTLSSRRRARSLDALRERDDGLDVSSAKVVPDTITTIQFVSAVSTLRVLAALALMLVLCVVAALLWIFLGPAGSGLRTGDGRQQSEGVGSGMGIGVLVLLLECVRFGAWMWGS